MPHGPAAQIVRRFRAVHHAPPNQHTLSQIGVGRSTQAKAGLATVLELLDFFVLDLVVEGGNSVFQELLLPFYLLQSLGDVNFLVLRLSFNEGRNMLCTRSFGVRMAARAHTNNCRFAVVSSDEPGIDCTFGNLPGPCSTIVYYGYVK